MTARPSAIPQRNPGEILEQQLQVLNRIYQTQVKQTELLERLNGQPGGGGRPVQGGAASTLVKIVDFNMPFWALTGMLIKVALATIPAALIISIFWALFFGALFFGLSILGVGLNVLRR